MFKWLEDITDKILEENINKETITCQCGISTTGIAHIGNFRELIITYLVSERLKQKGKNVKLLLSFDDFDRFKKVPKSVPKEYEKYIGMPNYSFPSHINSNIGYAEYYENRINEELKMLGIEMDYIYQSKNYLDNKYVEYIKLVLEKKEEIFDIIKKYKTQELTDEDRKKYYPVKIYCSTCKKDSTTILGYDSNNEKISYRCTCGNNEIKSIRDINIKMNFNVEWPMRWNYESVDFEPCGKGHSENLGALNISKEVNEKIYNQKNPVFLNYQFLNIKGSQGRMSKDSKDIITISDVLKVMPKELVLYFFLKSDNNKEMSLSLVEDIKKLYCEFEQLISSKGNQDIKNLLKIDYNEIIKFEDLVRFLPIADFNIEKLKKYIAFKETRENLEKIKYVTNWLKQYCQNKYWVVNNEFNEKYYSSLSKERKEELHKLSDLLRNTNRFDSTESFMDELNTSIKDKKNLYLDFYNMVFGVDKGIPLKSLIENYDMNKICSLLRRRKFFDDNLISRLIHLSDLHFDKKEDSKKVSEKWEGLIQKLKVGNYDNYLILSGDLVCFYDIKDGFDICYKYLSYLTDELKIPKEKIIICTGNHDIDFCSLSDCQDEKIIKERLKYFNSFMNRMCGINVSSIEELYYLKEYNRFDALVINSLPVFSSDSITFYQDTNRIKELLKTNVNNDKYKFVVSHTPYSYNKNLFDQTDINSIYKYNLCGHKFETDIVKNKNGLVDLVAGSVNGFVDNNNKYNLYELKENKILIKRLTYNNEWNLKELTTLNK